LVAGLIFCWLTVIVYSALQVPEFWSGAFFFAIGLAYAFYYAWSRAVRGSGQAGIVVIERDSPFFAKICADLAMLLVATLSLSALLGLDALLRMLLPMGRWSIP
jgi:hypothetical protein